MEFPADLQERIKADSAALREKYGPIVADVLENGLYALYDFFVRLADTYGSGTAFLLFAVFVEKETRVSGAKYEAQLKLGKEIGVLFASFHREYKAMLEAKEEVAGYD